VTLSDRRAPAPATNPWPALWAMVIGFFMIMVDTTIVAVAMPAMRDGLHTDYNTVIWVTSAYLLAYAVPLLITGRLGDRVGPKRIYLVGLTVFTSASLWCALTSSVEPLIAARVCQGFGASMMTPQTMAVITRTFPAASRGRAMALWGATAGVATLVGPVLGGVLIDAAGWEWIFFVNIPVGVVGLAMAWRLVPDLPTHSHSFDWVGVGLSAVAMFLIVFGIQEGERYDWGVITGVVSVPALIGLGAVVGAVFCWWQTRVRREPLVPLSLFRVRSYSVSATAISIVAFAVTGMSFPFMLWAQSARGWSPTESGMLLIPMAVMTVAMAPLAGRLTDRVDPRILTTVGFAVSAFALVFISRLLTADSPVWALLTGTALVGLGSSFLWSPLAATATRRLPVSSAGAGAGVYNTTRQVGAVLGSAAIAAAIESRLAAHLPQAAGASAEGSSVTRLPAAMVDSFSQAMSESLLVPAAAFCLGIALVQFFGRSGGPER